MHSTIHRMNRRLFNWDYRQRAIYMITVTLADRLHDWLGVLRKHVMEPKVVCGQTEQEPVWFVEPTQYGRAVQAALAEMPRKYPQIQILAQQLMPEHFHFIPFVQEYLPKPLGTVIQGFKAGATKRWKELKSPTIPAWAPGFTDTILFHQRQLAAMSAYIRDNPRRLGEKREHPDLFHRVLDLAVPLADGLGIGHFAAVGNSALLQRPLVQVQCARCHFSYQRASKPGGGRKIIYDSDGNPVIEFSSPAFLNLKNELFLQAQHGASLLSPCISDGERQIAREALQAGIPLVVLRNKGFPKMYKPPGKYFDACANGRLLMLAPAAWPYIPGDKPILRSEATALNRISQWLTGQGAAEINYHGILPENIDALALAAVHGTPVP